MMIRKNSAHQRNGRHDRPVERAGLSLAETLLGVGLAALAATALIAALTGVASLAGTAQAADAEEAQADQGTADEGAPGAKAKADDAEAQATAQSEPAERAANRIVLRRAGVKPRTIRYAGKRRAVFRFEFKGKRKRDIQIQVVHKRNDGSKVVTKRWNRDRVEPNKVHKVQWAARKPNGQAAKHGRYFFRIRERGGKFADGSKAKGNRNVNAYGHIFPVRGPHTYGDGIGAGRGHRGQDVFAKCGTKLVAARAGVVRHRAFQGSAAGHYVVISGRRSGMDYAYMHLRGKAKVREGQKVRTGEVIGRVGQSGNATGYHLHFELWSQPSWYNGGSHMNSVTKKLRRWDRWG